MQRLFGPTGRQKLKIKIKSLACEAKIIRKEEGRLKGSNWDRGRTELQQHRTGSLRNEARSALLAYAFLRKRNYWKTEASAATPPDRRRTCKLISKYGTMSYEVALQSFTDWVQTK